MRVEDAASRVIALDAAVGARGPWHFADKTEGGEHAAFVWAAPGSLLVADVATLASAELIAEYRTLAPQLARYVLAARAVVENAEALLRVDGNRGPDGRVATWDAGAFVRSRDALLAALARVAALSSPAQPTETTT